MVREGDVASASNYLPLEGILRGVGRRVQVYVDASDAAAIEPEVVADIVATFDEKIFPEAARTIGQARDVDGDGRFTVLISSWLTRLAGGRHAVDGFVRGADLDPGYAAPFGNRCDMMYLSTALRPGPHLRTVLAHEYTHAVTFSAKVLPSPTSTAPRGADEEGWLDEAIAHLMEDQHGFARSNLNYRVSAFLSRPELYRLVVEDYYAADLFRSHGNRGATYLFLRWCVDQFGPDLVPALVRSNRRGIDNLEAATGSKFVDLYRAWSLALFTSGFDPNGTDPSGLRSVDVRRPYDDWELAGPHTTFVEPGGPELAWESPGTASRYFVIGSSSAGAVEITITSSASAGLQVTALPLPENLAHLELSVRTVAKSGVDGEAQLVAEIRERNGTHVNLSALAWEPLVPGPDPHAPGFRRAGLGPRDIARAFGTTFVPPLGRLETVPINPAGALRGGFGPIVVKATGTDAYGRRVAAWAEIPAPGLFACGEPASRMPSSRSLTR
jgi:hypothetical protein